MKDYGIDRDISFGMFSIFYVYIYNSLRINGVSFNIILHISIYDFLYLWIFFLSV